MVIEKLFKNGNGDVFYAIPVTLILEALEEEEEEMLQKAVETILNDIRSGMDYGSVGGIYFRGWKLK